MEVVFRSRISILLIAFMFAIIIYAFVSLYKNKTYKGMYIVVGTLLFTASLFCSMRYVISEEKLYLKIWFTTKRSTEIADIVSVERSYNLFSSPAGSLKRLHIRFENGSSGWLISPVREREFIDMLKVVNPNIEVNVPEKKGIWCFWDWDI